MSPNIKLKLNSYNKNYSKMSSQENDTVDFVEDIRPVLDGAYGYAGGVLARGLLAETAVFAGIC